MKKQNTNIEISRVTGIGEMLKRVQHDLLLINSPTYQLFNPSTLSAWLSQAGYQPFVLRSFSEGGSTLN